MEANNPGGYLRETFVGDIVPNSRTRRQRTDYKRVKAVVFELFVFEKKEIEFYMENPHLMEFKETQFYNFPKDENKLFPVERVRVPMLAQKKTLF